MTDDSHVRVPAEIAGVDIEDSGSRHGGRRGGLEVTDLKEHAHRRRQRDSLVAGQRQDLVVVHHRVERLDPHRVDITVENDPLGTLVRQVGQVAHYQRQQA